MSSDLTMSIAGKSVGGVDRFEVINPATGLAFSDAPKCDLGQLDEAFEAARLAQVEWGRDDNDRRRCLRLAAQAIGREEQRLASMLTREQGKPLVDARREVASAVRWFSYYADLEVPEREVLIEDERGRRVAFYSPLGVVAAITPWNFPVTLACWKLAPALRAGNSVVLKPSPYTPLATLLLGEILRPLFPPGVVNIVSGGDEIGAAMTTHAIPRKVSFTGSTRGGKAIAASSSATLKRLTLELGGNDPAVVLPSANIERIAETLFWRAFHNNGQICGAIKRVYVHRDRYSALVSHLAALADAATVGDGALPDTVLGPVNNKPQYVRVHELLDDALAHGARIAAGGTSPIKEGYFIRPTILTDVGDGVRIVDEEQFGPILPIVPYDDLDQVISTINRCEFGLGASVWGDDLDAAREAICRIDSGSLWINSHGVIGPEDIFGGARSSGIGVEGGLPGLRSFSQLHVLHDSAGAL